MYFLSHAHKSSRKFLFTIITSDIQSNAGPHVDRVLIVSSFCHYDERKVENSVLSLIVHLVAFYGKF
jgi:hypothetical protein